ncbi:MAG: hypothetical protein ACREA3_02500 [Nitrosotalea sp.]
MVDLTSYFLEESRKSRRSIYGHIIMLETLRECFENKDPIRTASRKAGTSESTVRKYYAKWKKQRLEDRDYEYHIECIQLKQQARAGLFKDQKLLYDRVNGLAKSLDSLKKQYQNTVKS